LSNTEGRLFSDPDDKNGWRKADSVGFFSIYDNFCCYVEFG